MSQQYVCIAGTHHEALAARSHLMRSKPAAAQKVRTQVSLLQATSCTSPDADSRISRPLVMALSESVTRSLQVPEGFRNQP